MSVTLGYDPKCLKCESVLVEKIGPRSSWLAFECEECFVSYTFASILSANEFFSEEKEMTNIQKGEKK